MPFATVVIVTGVFAALCAGGFPLWLLGVPGVDGNYARGWKRGLSVLFLYPIAWLVACAPYYFQHARLDEIARAHWQQRTAVVVGFLFLLVVVALVQAFGTMRKKDTI